MITAAAAAGVRAVDQQLSDVKLLTDDRRAHWDAYVRGHDSGTFYHLSGWQGILENHLRHSTYYLYVERAGMIEGMLPIARVKSWLFGDALISLPFLVYGGPLASSEEARVKLIDYAVSLAEELGVDYLELRNRRAVTDWPAKTSYVTFRKEMAPDPEGNLKAIPRKQRAMIRKGIKAGLRAEVDDTVARLYRVLSECKRNLGTPFLSKAYLKAVAETFGDDCDIVSILDGGHVVSSVMSFRFRDEILPYYGGGGTAARDLAANDFMYWKVMERACESGLRIFDYGRSQKDTGAYRFKRHWGFEPETLSYEYYLVRATDIPKLDPSNSNYQRLISLWKRLPLPVANTVGPRIARLLG